MRCGQRVPPSKGYRVLLKTMLEPIAAGARFPTPNAPRVKIVSLSACQRVEDNAFHPS
jgi:hypothetical protein